MSAIEKLAEGGEPESAEPLVVSPDFNPILLSVLALKRMAERVHLPVIDELLAQIPSETTPKTESLPVTNLDEYRAKRNLDSVDSLVTETQTARSVSTTTEASKVASTLPKPTRVAKTESLENELLDLHIVKDFVNVGVGTQAEVDELADKLELSNRAEFIAELQRRGFEIVDYEKEEVATPSPAKVYGEDKSGVIDPLQLFMNEAGRYKLLNAAEEVVLAKAIEKGDKAAKDRMINSNLRLVMSIAKRYQGHDVPLLDLVQEGAIGLNRAAEKFDWRKGYKFSTYATWWIRQACQRAVANQGETIRIPVHVQERRIKLNRARSEFMAKEKREPSYVELANLTHLKVEHVIEALEAVDAISLNSSIGEDGDAELGDMYADETAEDPAESSIDAMNRKEIQEALIQLPEQHRRIIEMRFGFDGPCESLETIGKELKLTRERVRQLEAEAMQALGISLENKLELERRTEPLNTRSDSW